MGLLGRLFKRAPEPVPLPPLVPSLQPPLLHCGFAVIHHGPVPGAYVLTARAAVNDVIVGLSVRFLPDWEPCPFGPSIPVNAFRGQIQLVSDGLVSDAFVAVLDRLYGTGLAPTGMRSARTFTAVSLAGEPYLILLQPMQIALYFGASEEAPTTLRYAEASLRVDLKHGQLVLAEKDQCYRNALVSALAAG